MSSFEEAVRVVLAHEGLQFTDDAADPGGATKGGITLAWARAHGLDIDRDGDTDALDVAALTADMVATSYRTHIWDRFRYERLEEQVLGDRALDLAVWRGPRRCHLLFQRACNQLGARLDEDGDLGPVTVAAINAQDPLRILHGIAAILVPQLKAWCDACGAREKFRRGLLRRARWPFAEEG